MLFPDAVITTAFTADVVKLVVPETFPVARITVPLFVKVTLSTVLPVDA
jgi:hypothetical protein